MSSEIEESSEMVACVKARELMCRLLRVRKRRRKSLSSGRFAIRGVGRRGN
jgi:hypothetical protein